MFVWSFRASKREITIFIIGAAAFIIAAVMLLLPDAKSTSTLESSGYSLDAQTGVERTMFLKQFGWSIDPEPVSVREVIIPTQFNDVYKAYNTLQLEQGFDLENYKGIPVKMWTYNITNYPGGGEVLANIIVHEGKVIGGDICSAQLGGFMHGFDPQQQAAQTAMAQLSDNAIDRSVPASIPEQPDAPAEPEDII